MLRFPRLMSCLIVVSVSMASNALAQGGYQGTTAAAATNTMKVDNPTNSDGNQTTMTSITISSGGTVYVQGVDYTVSGLGTKHVTVTWIAGRKPPEGTELTVAGETAAQGQYTVTITWP